MSNLVKLDKYEPKPFVFGLDKKKIPVNIKCPCGSGKKFKRCCTNPDSNSGYTIIKCQFCNLTIHSLGHEDYLNHVEDDLDLLTRSLTELASTESNKPLDEDIPSADVEYEPSPQIKLEIDRRMKIIEEIDEYLTEQRKTYPDSEI